MPVIARRMWRCSGCDRYNPAAAASCASCGKSRTGVDVEVEDASLATDAAQPAADQPSDFRTQLEREKAEARKRLLGEKG